MYYTVCKIMKFLGIDEIQIGRGDNTGLYLTRWIFKLFGRKYYLHCFHQADLAEPHNHPWSYTTIILYGGYFERTDSGVRWYGPGSILRRKVGWKHRIEIPEGKKVWTLFMPGPKTQPWGFFCKDGFRHHVLAEKALAEKGNVCA